MGAQRIRSKQVAAAVIVERVENDRDGIVIKKFIVAPELCRKDAGRVGVVAPNRKNDALLRIENFDFGSFRGGLTFKRILLKKFRNSGSFSPCGLLEHTVRVDH